MTQPSCHHISVGVLSMLGVLLGFASMPARADAFDVPEVRRLTLRECIHTALLQNRALQIERLNPVIARSSLDASYGYYDPIFSLDVRTEDSSDSGGFDPEDFSRDAVFSAESEVARGGLSGWLPSGLTYTLGGSYAHSDGFRNGFNFESYSLLTGVTVRQPLLRNFWIDQGRMTIRVNKKNLQITELGVRYVAMDVVNRVQQAYYELVGTIGEMRVREELRLARQQLLAGVRRRIEMGTLTVLDEKLADAQVATVEADLIIAGNAVQLAENELKALLGDTWTNSVDSRLVPAEALFVWPEVFDLPLSWQRGLTNRPDLAQFRQEAEKSQIDLQYRRNQLFPSLDLFASHTRKGASTGQLLPPLTPEASLSDAGGQIVDGDVPSSVLGIVLSVPLSRTTERGNYRVSKQLKARAELRVKQYEEQVLREISDALHTARACLERVGLARRARALCEDALHAEEQKLAGGKSTLFVVLDLQKTVAASRSAEVQAKVDYNQAVSQLRFAEATLLDQMGLAVEIQ